MNGFQLKGLSKPKSLKKLKGFGKQNQPKPLPDLDVGQETVANLVDDELARWTTALGSESLAKKLQKLRDKKYPDATLPELVCLEWLERKRYKFEFQVWLLGGRVLKGGQVVDVVVDVGARVMILEVQGNYWHTRPGAIQRDEGQKYALLGLTVWGKKVAGVIALWESRLVQPVASKREQVMQLAMRGIELGM